MALRQIKTVLFDLDGTLLDSVPGIVESFQATLKEFKITPSPSRAHIVSTLGMPLSRQMLDFSGCEHKAKKMIDYYVEHNQRIIPKMQLFSGVPETLTALKKHGYKLGVVTAKFRKSAFMSFHQHQLTAAMDVLVTGSDTTNHKPHPEPLHYAMEKLGSHPESTVYIGDAVHDLQAAKAARCHSIGALWGPNPHQVLIDEAPTATCHSIHEVRDLLCRTH